MDRTVDKKLEIEAFLTDVASRKEGMVYMLHQRAGGARVSVVI